MPIGTDLAVTVHVRRCSRRSNTSSGRDLAEVAASLQRHRERPVRTLDLLDELALTG